MRRRNFLSCVAVAFTFPALTFGRTTRSYADTGCPDVLDWRDLSGYARDFDIIDLRTGKPHANPDIFYADARQGFIRYCRRDASGKFFVVDKVTGLPVKRISIFRRHRRIGGEFVKIPTMYVTRPDGSRVWLFDGDVECAWAEERHPIRIVRKSHA